MGLIKIAARNLQRNLRRTLITACAIGGGLALLVWADTLAQGTYAALIQRAADLCEKYERPVATWQQARDILQLPHPV